MGQSDSKKFAEAFKDKLGKLGSTTTTESSFQDKVINNTPLLVGICVGGAVILFLACLAAYMCWRHEQKQVRLD